MAKGIYIVSESACMNPGTGAKKHIDIGIAELRKSFDISLVLFCPLPAQAAGVSKGTGEKSSPGYFKKMLKWWYLLITNHLSFFKYYREVKSGKPDFIYERASYLNYNGYFISRWLKIPHYYEVNGVVSEDNREYFPASCTQFAFRFEKYFYKRSLGFYVGGINKIYGIEGKRAVIIQNGIEKEFLQLFGERKNVAAGKIKIVFIGHAMAHHRLDILVEALRLVKQPSAFSMHLIGTYLEYLKEELPAEIETKLYGSLSHDQIAVLIKDFNVGIIPFALDYFSHVKVFMYGAAKLTMLLPSTRNFVDIFNDDEVIFVRNGDPADIASKLDALQQDSQKLEVYGERVYKKIEEKYTWDRVYEAVRGRCDDNRQTRIVNSEK